MRLTALLLLPVSISAAEDPVGAQLYRKHCAVCHDVGGNSRIPPQSALRQGGGLFAFRTDNGERLWMTPAPGCGDRRPCSPAQSAAVSAIEGTVSSGSVDAHLRAYSTATGKIFWDFDAVRAFPTVNGVLAKGGAFDAAGVVIAGGMLFAGSGYGQWGGLPGNVLLAFSVEGR